MRKIFQTIKLDFIDVVILVFYYLFVCFLFLGLSGLFNRFLVGLVLAILLVILFFFRRSIYFSKNYLWFFALVPLVASGFGLLRGFFTGDTYGQWLPAARDIILTGRFPGFETNYYFSGMPLMSFLFAGTFLISNSLNEILNIWIPFFFTAASLIVIIQWAKDRNLDKKFLFFIPVLFLTNTLVQFYGSWNLLQESLVLFFATAFFYYYEKYSANQETKDLIFLFLSLTLASASKISGLFLFIIVPFLFFKSRRKTQLLSYLFFFSLPIIIWLIRNYLVFDNPVFPVFNGFFKGRYYEVNRLFGAYHVLPASLISFWGRYLWVIKNYLFIAFPFIILSLYGFIKERRYDYLFLVGLYFLIKEYFLFTPNDSSIRYFYMFLGLFLVYALLGLARLKSRWFITLLTGLALAGLLLTPIANSSSAFIYLFENRLFLLRQIFNYLHNYWYLFIVVLTPFIYRASQKEELKIFLIFLYSFFIFHLRFVANKSWLNTWPFIVLALLFLLLFIFKERIKYLKEIIIISVVLAVFVNSWAMASVYYLRQGKISFPVEYLFKESKWARYVLNSQTISGQRKDFYVLISAQTGYFAWWTDYQSLTLFSRNFWHKIGNYRNNLSDEELRRLLKDNRVKYIIKNEVSFDYYSQEYEKFFQKIANSDIFQLLAQKEGQYFVWQVYEN